MSSSSSLSDSYPPLFRQTTTTTTTTTATPPPPPPATLPTLDLTSISPQLLHSACVNWGIFRLTNHGIPHSLLRRLHSAAHDVFGLGFEAKKRVFEGGPVSYFWGTPALTPGGAALSKGGDFNWVEGLNVGVDRVAEIISGVCEGEEEEDPLITSFRSILEEYGNHQSRLARTLFEAMARNLKLSSEQSDSYLSLSTGVLRVYRYPPCSEALADQQAWGMEVHTDSSVLSILNQDQVGGLQLLKDDVWLDVQPVPNTLLVNIGDMMQAMSNDVYRSVKHRVKVPKYKERISVGYFVFPEDHSVIQSSTYRPFTYADFRAQVQQDIKTIGYKVGLQRFRLN